MIAGVVPVKPLRSGKTRLEAALGREATQRLSLAMLEDVIGALRAVEGVAPVGVVTPDETVAACARSAGALALLGSDPGLNRSLERAARTLAPTPPRALLVVLGDVAGARSAELAALLDAAEALGEPCVALAPSRDGGTSALLRIPHDVIPCCFGPDSAARHREQARRAGVPHRELALASLAIDLDTEQDLRAFLNGPGDGARTRAVLDEIGFGSTP